MDNTLQVLTEKLFNEGVEKGKEQAEKIIAEAKSEAGDIIGKAHVHAEEILSIAKKKAADLENNTRSELQLASKQVVNALKQEITTIVGDIVISSAIRDAIEDKVFMQNLILAAVSNWAEKQDLTVVVSEKDQADLVSFLSIKAKELFERGLTIESANQVKAGFQIGPSDGSYKVSFTESDFISFFKEFLRPKVVELLFGQK